LSLKLSVFSQPDLQPQLALIDIDQLKEHEEVNPEDLERLRSEIESDGILRMPIAVDRNTNIIIDGHHRLHALKQLLCKRVPVVFINYQSYAIIVEAWRRRENVTKKSVLDAALTGRRLPPKTSKHLILLNGVFKHISAIEEEVNIPLENLR